MPSHLISQTGAEGAVDVNATMALAFFRSKVKAANENCQNEKRHPGVGRDRPPRPGLMQP
jgi:hypothetical protein